MVIRRPHWGQQAVRVPPAFPPPPPHPGIQVVLRPPPRNINWPPSRGLNLSINFMKVFSSFLHPFLDDILKVFSYFLHPFFETYFWICLLMSFLIFLISLFWTNPRRHSFYSRIYIVSVHSPFSEKTCFNKHTSRKGSNCRFIFASIFHQFS